MTARTLLLSFALGLPALALAQDGSSRHTGDLSAATDTAKPASKGERDAGASSGAATGEVKLLKQFDKDGDEHLNAGEREAARAFLAKQKADRRGPSKPKARKAQDGNLEPPQPGAKISPMDAKLFPKAPIYDAQVFRTFFLRFDDAGWEKELEEFHDTDVEVPATLIVDGKTYRDVGVSFRGGASFFNVGAGRKRSLKLALDLADPDQLLDGYHTLNLLNGYGDPTFLRTILYYHIAREFIPAPKANYVRVVINGESWGVYLNAQHFNTDFTRDWFRVVKGARWKVDGARGRAGLNYLGEDLAEYQRRYDMKSKENAKAWADLINLCRVLHETPADKLETALAPLLDLDGTLKYLALENALINSDGQWSRAGDYNLFQDEKGIFHLIPQDANETFGPARDNASRGQGETAGIELDPLAGADDPKKPLLHKLLAVPALRARYLAHVRAVAEQGLDWSKLGPLVTQYQSLIADEVKNETRRLHPFSAFTAGVTEDFEEGARGSRRNISMKHFVERRREFLLGHPEIRKLAAMPIKEKSAVK